MSRMAKRKREELEKQTAAAEAEAEAQPKKKKKRVSWASHDKLFKVVYFEKYLSSMVSYTTMHTTSTTLAHLRNLTHTTLESTLELPSTIGVGKATRKRILGIAEEERRGGMEPPIRCDGPYDGMVYPSGTRAACGVQGLSFGQKQQGGRVAEGEGE